MKTNERNRFKLDLYGFEVESLYKYGLDKNIFKKLDGIVVCHGKIPYTLVKDKIAEADYTILVRPQKRYANAGFPTKVGESLACGTPVITNITSDLDKYLTDMGNCVICKDETIDSCKKALLRAADIGPKKYEQMRQNSIYTANRYFSYQAYSRALYRYIEDKIR